MPHFIYKLVYTPQLTIPRTSEAAIIIYVWWKKKLLEGPTLKRSFFDETEVFGFWMVPACSKVWCFEWHGILSIPQVCEERITHVSTLKTFPEKVRNWNGINSQPNGVNFQPNGVICLGCFQCIFALWHVCQCSPGCVNIRKVRKMHE